MGGPIKVRREMKLWLIWQTENNDYDTYDAAVVAAETEEDARKTPPCDYPDFDNEWAPSPNKVKVELIGEARPNTEAGVILASYRPG